MSLAPFRTGVTVDDAFFTDRAHEVERIRAALGTPAARLLVYGPRRMGKSSAIGRAIRQVQARKGLAFLADLSTASTPVDVANRIMEAATRALGRSWKDMAADWATRVGATLKLTPDAKTGLVIPSLDVGLRKAEPTEQRQGLERVLDAVDAMAAARRKVVGIALDEFQEITRLGGEEAEWHLRGVVQRHQHVGYVLAGSEPHLIQRMLGPRRAFYDMLEVLHFGPIEPGHFARWLEERLQGAGVKAAGLGPYLIALAGPRTRDVVLLAQQVWAIAGKVATRETADEAFARLVEEQEDLLHAFWAELTPLQQNVLRAVAVQARGLTSADAQERFGLTNSSATSQALAAFVEEGRLVRDDDGGYAFDNPLLRGWVVDRTLPDIGVHLPITHRPPAPAPAPAPAPRS